MSLREDLRARRRDLGLSAREVVDLVRRLHPHVRGVHLSAIRAWERGADGRSPSDVQLDAWARVLGFELVLQPVAAAEPAPAPRRRRAA